MDAVLELKELISARKKEGLPTPAGPTVAEKTASVTKAEAAPGAARPVSSASITPDMARSTAKPPMSGRKWGCGLVACGSSVLAVGLVMVAAIVMAEFDPAQAVDDPMVTIGRMAICILPIFLVGGGLLVFGITRLRAQRQPPSATEFGGYRTKAEKEAWAQAMVGAEFITEGKYRDALTISEQALAKSPRCKEAWVVKGGALALLNRPEEALACYEQALAIDPSYEEALTQKAALLQVG
jgi:cytochrome c-type biogenesis protein CcmH/NrfG